MNNRLKILLCAINEDTLPPNIPSVALPIFYLKSFVLKDRLLKKKVEIQIAEFTNSAKSDNIVKSILKHNPKIVGFSCYIWNRLKTLSVCKKLKSKNKEIKIVLGGPEVSPVAKDILDKNRSIDIIVSGEGEATFKELAGKFIKNNPNLKSVKGITYKIDKQIYSNQGREVIKNLNTIPFPYDENILSDKKRGVCLETQRGCVFNCAFCYYQKSYKGVRFFGLNRTKRDLSTLLKHKLKRIYMMDPVFNYDTTRAKDILKFIIKHNKHNTPFNTELKAELVDEEMAKLLKRANFKQLEVGLQSTDKTVLKNINRKLNRKNFERGFKLLQKYEVPADLQLIFGLPGDNMRKFLKSVDYAAGLKPFKLVLFDLSVLPGTKIWRNADKLGIVYEKHPVYRIISSESFSKRDVIRFRNMRPLITQLHNSWLLNCLNKDTGITISELALAWHDWFEKRVKREGPIPDNVMKDFFFDFIKTKKNVVNVTFYKHLINAHFSKKNLRKAANKRTKISGGAS